MVMTEFLIAVGFVFIMAAIAWQVSNLRLAIDKLTLRLDKIDETEKKKQSPFYSCMQPGCSNVADPGRGYCINHIGRT
jgi:hypothetical protein